VRVPRNVAKSTLTALIMRNHLIFLGLLATTLLGSPAFSGQGPAPANEEQAVRKAAAAYFEAMNKGDLDGLMTCLAPDADFIDLSEPVRAANTSCWCGARCPVSPPAERSWWGR
jgi:hypothetical protein